MTDTTFILWIQQFSNSFLDSFFTIITKIGNPEYYMVAFPLFYWCVNKRQAFRFTLFFLISSYANTLIKGITDVPRPSGDEVRILYHESTQGSSSFPSGHTQGTAAFWGYLANYFKNKYFTAISIVIIALVGISRMYLGLHFPIDVVGGLLFAFIILILYNLLYDSTVNVLKVLPWSLKLVLSGLLPILLLMLPGHDKGMLVGFTVGLMIGYQIEGRYLTFSTSAPLLKQILKFVIGIAGLFGLRVILKEMFIIIGLSDITTLGADVLRYAVVGLWASYLAPLTFVALGLSDRRILIPVKKFLAKR